MRIVAGILLILVLVLPTAAQDATPAAADDPVQMAAAFIQNMIDGEFEAARADFDPLMLENAPPEVLENIWQQITSQLGALVSVGEPRYDAETNIVRIRLEFENATVDAVIPFNSENQIAGFTLQPPSEDVTPTPVPEFAPPSYADQELFTEIDVIIGEDTDFPLPATLSLPNGDGPFPAVVIVHGSGPSDRDLTLGPNKPYRDLAWGLASRGIAVLRYDKRTLVHGMRMDAQTVTVWDETIDDAVLAIELLQTTEGVDPERVYLLGHSLGGYLAPRIAEAAPDLAGVIVLAGSTLPLEESLLNQVRFLAELDGEINEAEAHTIAQLEEQVAAVKALQPGDTLENPLLGIPAAYWLDLQDYDPAALAAGLPQPFLILQGERDYQVTAADDLARWQEALGEREDVTIITYPALNHVFLAGEGAPNPQEYEIEGHIPVEVIEDITGWILGV